MEFSLSDIRAVLADYGAEEVTTIEASLREVSNVSEELRKRGVVVYSERRLKSCYKILGKIDPYKKALCNTFDKKKELFDLGWLEYYCIMFASIEYTFNHQTLPMSRHCESDYITMWKCISNLRKDSDRDYNPMFYHIRNRNEVGYMRYMGIPFEVNKGSVYVLDLIKSGKYAVLERSLEENSKVRKIGSSEVYYDDMFCMYK